MQWSQHTKLQEVEEEEKNSNTMKFNVCIVSWQTHTYLNPLELFVRSLVNATKIIKRLTAQLSSAQLHRVRMKAREKITYSNRSREKWNWRFLYAYYAYNTLLVSFDFCIELLLGCAVRCCVFFFHSESKWKVRIKRKIKIHRRNGMQKSMLSPLQ